MKREESLLRRTEIIVNYSNCSRLDLVYEDFVVLFQIEKNKEEREKWLCKNFGLDHH